MYKYINENDSIIFFKLFEIRIICFGIVRILKNEENNK